MQDINLINIGGIQLSKKESLSMDNFSFGTISGTGAAASFVFNDDSLKSDTLDWSIELRFVNGSGENIIINCVNCKFKGLKGYISESRRHTYISESISNTMKAKRLLGQIESTSLERHLPLMIPHGSEKTFKFSFALETYQKKWFFFTNKISFEKSKIVAPQTYSELIQDIVISVKLQGKKKPIFLII